MRDQQHCPQCKRNWTGGKICPYCFCDLVAGKAPAPPAEPDSGIQEKIMKAGDHECEYESEHEDATCKHCGLTSGEAIRYFESICVKPDAPADHVEHVLEKALKALRLRLSTKPPWYRETNNDNAWYVTNFTHDQMEGNRLACVEQIDKALLSEHRSGSEVSGGSVENFENKNQRGTSSFPARPATTEMEDGYRDVRGAADWPEAARTNLEDALLTLDAGMLLCALGKCKAAQKDIRKALNAERSRQSGAANEKAHRSDEAQPR